MKISNLLYVMVVGLALLGADASLAATSADYVAVPPFLAKGADANVMLDLSIETPMQGAAYNDQPNVSTGCGGRILDGGTVGVCYSPTQEYLGIFDPSKCYNYSSSRFEPAGLTNTNHECSGQWSGNFLNWATMTAIDEFRWALTGGNRVVDTTSLTVVERANIHSLPLGHSWYPVKMLTSANNVAPSTVTPYADSKLYIYNHGYQVDIGTSWGGHERAENYQVRAKVCDPSQGLEANCVDYNGYFKPEGLMQKNAGHMRFALMGYANDNNHARGGGVLRSNMKYVGPYLPGGVANPAAEFGTDGIYIVNPEGATEGQSGAINYLNKFGANGYKAYDPAGELFFECINYFKHQGPTPEYVDGTLAFSGGDLIPSAIDPMTAFNDGFPIITNWTDPIEYHCQKNFIIAINDANPWEDKRLPGTHFTSSTFNGFALRSTSYDWGEPFPPASHPSRDVGVDVTALTNTVGDLQGITNTNQYVGATDLVADMVSNLKLVPGLGEVAGTAPWAGKENSYYIAGLAYYANTQDLRPDFEGRQTINTFMIDTQEYNNTPLTGQMNMLWLAGKYGGFHENDFNDTNNDGNDYEPNDPSEWDKDGDGEPDNYVLATNPKKMIDALSRAFYEVNKQMSSGTSASVVSNTRSGEGAIYQSVFYPQKIYTDSSNNDYFINWGGQIHALLVDAHGNMREDTNQNGRLDWADDLFLVFNGTTVEKYRDGILSGFGTTGSNGRFDDYERTATPVETGTADTIKYLWSSTDWLNTDSGLDPFDPLTQRSYTASNKQRYIFTFIDDGDMVADSSEIFAFTKANKGDIAPYLHAFHPFSYTAVSPPPGVVAADYTDFVDHQADRVIDWIRGEDQGVLNFGSSTIPPMRSRYYVEGGIDKTWRLGDIINSTPTVVGRPAEDFDLLYYDQTFSQFYSDYKNRRNVVYVGGNDGMFHAFNAGFYDSLSKSYLKRPKIWDSVTSSYVDDMTKTNFDLGAEMWAYIPHNLLPHLYWLTDPDYGHIYYNDLKPKVFDANIFPDDATHLGGWGTVLVGGMRFGGGKIKADLNKDGIEDATDKAMTSAYYVLDITNPEVPPTLLAEFTLPGMGYTTNYPMVVTLRDKGMDGSVSPTDNDWYLLFGSGPANSAGEPDSTALQDASSDQDGKIFMLSLNRLISGSGEVCFMNSSGTCVNNSASTPGPLVTLDADSFISDAIGVDWDIDFKNDAVYFGTVSGDAGSGWGGKFRRIVVNDNPTVSSWDLDNVFLDLSPGHVTGSSPVITTGQPITAAASAGLDKQGNRWLYFGTGRYLTTQDALNADQQSYYGLKEPRDSSFNLTYATLNRANDLFDSTDVKVYEGGADVTGFVGVNYAGLQSAVALKDGWFMDFPDLKERNIGQATLLGKILTFTSYIPNDAPCEVGGESWVYALDYETGTAYKHPVIGIDTSDSSTVDPTNKKVLKRKLIGSGLATSPGLHTGREAGAKAFIQSSTGAIETFEENTPGRTKSGMSSWQAE